MNTTIKIEVELTPKQVEILGSESMTSLIDESTDAAHNIIFKALEVATRAL